MVIGEIKVNTYRVVTVNGEAYIESVLGGSRKWYGRGKAAKELADKTCEKWNAASERYSESCSVK